MNNFILNLIPGIVFLFLTFTINTVAADESYGEDRARIKNLMWMNSLK